MRIFLAVLAAIVAPASIMIGLYLYGQFMTFEASDPYIWIRTRNFSIICLLVSALFVVVLGLPAYLLLRWRHAVRWWSTLVSGFVLAAVPFAILAWPLRFTGPGSSASVNGVPTMVDGVPTMAGWEQYLAGVGQMGALGVVGAFAFWLVQRR
jgi:hypothetical protein